MSAVASFRSIGPSYKSLFSSCCCDLASWKSILWPNLSSIKLWFSVSSPLFLSSYSSCLFLSGLLNVIVTGIAQGKQNTLHCSITHAHVDPSWENFNPHTMVFRTATLALGVKERRKEQEQTNNSNSPAHHFNSCCPWGWWERSCTAVVKLNNNTGF